MKRAILMRERRLMLDSEVIKDYPRIRIILEENSKINQKLIDSLPQDQRDFFKNVLPFVLKEATNEWKGDVERNFCDDMGPDKHKWKRCSLDNRLNRYIFYIVNNLNGKRLNVGSCCIKRFWDGKVEGKTIKQMMENRNKLKVLSTLEKNYPGITRDLDNWESYIDSFDVIIPYSLETPYLELGKKAKGLIERYLKKSDADLHKLVNEVGEIICEKEGLIDRIKDHVVLVRNNKFAPNKNIRTWLRANSSGTTREALNEIKKCGLITWKSAWRIQEYSFMKSLIFDLNKTINQLGVTIINVDRSREGYILVARRQKNIKLFARHRDLILDCGWVLFDDEPKSINLENIIKHCSLYEEKSINEVINKLNGIVKNKGIRFGYPDFEQNDIDLFDGKTNTYLLCNLKKVAEEFKGLVLGCKNRQPKDIEQYIYNYKGKRYSKEQLRDLRQSRREFNIVQY